MHNFISVVTILDPQLKGYVHPQRLKQNVNALDVHLCSSLNQKTEVRCNLVLFTVTFFLLLIIFVFRLSTYFN